MAGITPNAGISATGCPRPNCTCSSVIVRLHDRAGKTVNGIVLPRALAESFRAQLSAVLDGPDAPAATSLRSIRCEGTA